MTIPTDSLSVLWYALLVVPGAVFIGVRTVFQGVRDGDRSVSAKVFAAFLASVFFDLVYLIVLAQLISERGENLAGLVARKLPLFGILALLLGFGVPAVSAWLLFGQPPFLNRLRQQISGLRSWFTTSRRALVPTAWDMAAVSAPYGFIRVRLAPNVWVGGRWEEAGYFSTFPEPRDVFISEPWHLDEDGAFVEPVEGGTGLWVTIMDEYVVEWVAPAADEENKA